MAHISWLVAESHNLAHGSLFRIQGHNHNNLKYANDTRLVDIIILSRPSIHEYETLVSFD